MLPCTGYFRIVFTFGEKASEEVFNSNLSDSIKKELFQAKKYAEGRTIQLEVKTSDDLDNIQKLIRIKLSN
jgi:hypothetical protein